jgi:hypothetical protein
MSHRPPPTRTISFFVAMLDSHLAPAGPRTSSSLRHQKSFSRDDRGDGVRCTSGVDNNDDDEAGWRELRAGRGISSSLAGCCWFCFPLSLLALVLP